MLVVTTPRLVLCWMRRWSAWLDVGAQEGTRLTVHALLCRLVCLIWFFTVDNHQNHSAFGGHEKISRQQEVDVAIDAGQFHISKVQGQQLA